MNFPQTQDSSKSLTASTSPGTTLEQVASPITFLTTVYSQIEQMISTFSDNPEALAHLMIGLSELKRQHSVVADAAEEALIDAMPAKKVDFGPGIGIVELKNASSRTGWRTEELIKDVLAAAWAAGDINSPDDVASILRESVSMSAGKSNKQSGTGAARYNLDLGDYCHEVWKQKILFASKPVAK